jgi:hypothetical protein
MMKPLGQLENELVELDRQIDECNEEIPSELARQIELLCKYLRIVGDIQAHYVYLYKRAYADRKAKYGLTLKDYHGTVKEKEGEAERATYHKRVVEGQYESDMTRWMNIYNATKELIQAKKITLKILKYELWGVHGD